jgi:hypothetical protein
MRRSIVMTCPACRSALPKGVRLCPQCGAKLELVKGAKGETRVRVAAPGAEPPVPAGPPRARGAATASSWRQAAPKLGCLAGIALALAIGARVGWVAWRTSKVHWETVFEQKMALAPKEMKYSWIEADFEGPYLLEVESKEGRARVLLVKGKPSAKTFDDAVRMAEQRLVADPAGPVSGTGRMQRGAYSWYAANDLMGGGPANIVVRLRALRE